MDIPFLLAQATEAVEKGVDIGQTIIQGGVALILLIVAVVLGVAYWKLLQRSHAQEKERLEETRDDASQRLKDQGDLLREQLDREREATEVITATVNTVEGFSHTLKEQKAACETTHRAIESFAREQKAASEAGQRALEEMSKEMTRQMTSMSERLRDVEETVRRGFRDAQS